MSFLRRAVAGVWNLLKPADATSNTVIEATETTEKEIDLVIEKSEGLLSYAAAASNPDEETLVTAAAAKLVVSKTNIKQKVVGIRTRRGTQRADDVEDKNLHDIDSKVNNSFTANRQAAGANNTNAIACNTLSNDLDNARGVILDDLPIPISPEQAGQAVLAQAEQATFNQRLAEIRTQYIAQVAQEIFNQRLAETGTQYIAQAAHAVLNQVLAQTLYRDIEQATQATQAAQAAVFTQVLAQTSNQQTAQAAVMAVVKEAVAAAQAAAAQAAAASPEVAERARQVAVAAAQAAAASPEAQAAAKKAADAAGPEFQAAAQAAQEAQTAAQAARPVAEVAAKYFATLVPQVGIASLHAVVADQQQGRANDELNKKKYECLPDIFFEYNQYNDKDKEKLTELRKQVFSGITDTSQFRIKCVEDSVLQLRNLLHLRQGLGVENEIITSLSRSFMATFTESWAPYLNRPVNNNDTSVDTNNRIFYNRVTSCLDALDTYSVFSSSQWAAYKRSTTPPFCPQIVSCNASVTPARIEPRPAVRAHVPPAPPPPPGPQTPADSYYDTVPIGPYNYVIGPILDFSNIAGRIFIYIKCYDDLTYTTGTYFWVYRSQSEGLYRVFFKIIPNKSIEKGYDYTQATLVHFKLQLALNKYYDRHAQRGVKNPIIINTLSRLNYFVGNMSYLQDVSFLDTFPNRANIIPSFYSIPGEANTVWIRTDLWGDPSILQYKPGYCDRARTKPRDAPHMPPCQPGQPGVLGQAECCYVCLIPSAVTVALPYPNVKMGMIGHYYMIDARYEPIIHKGFPMDNIYAGMADIKAKERDVYVAELAAYFPNEPANNPYFTFSRRRTHYDTTYPYIFCFTTCCLITPCSSFDLFLDPERYKKTFWCQGFQDFTTLLTINQANPDDPANPIVYRPLSPVLHVVIGSMLSEPDFYLSGFRYGILNVNPSKHYHSTSQRLDEYKKSTQIFMTLETTGETVSIYQPSIDPYPRRSALLAFEGLRDTFNKVNIQYQRRLFPEQHENVIQQRSLVMDKVEKKINMIKFIACIWHSCYTSLTPPIDDTSYNKIIEILTLANNLNIIPQINELYAKTGLTLAVADPAKQLLFVNSIQRMITGIDLEDVRLAYNSNSATQEMILNACKFILVCPSVAATAIIEYAFSIIYTNGKIKFEEDLIDYALLCLKKNWLGGMMDNAYETDTTVFGDIRNRKLYYFNNAGDFIYMRGGIFECKNPNDPANADLYVHKSSFDEVKEEGGVKDPVTVLTLANIYRLDCYYTKMPGNIVKSMSIVYQVSSTIVYTREVTPRILHAMDMQKIPLTFLPDLPEVIALQPTPMVGGGREKVVKQTGKPAAKPAASAAAKPAAAAAKPAAAAAAKQGKNPKKAAAAMPLEKPRATAKTPAQQDDQIIGQELIDQVSFLQSQQIHIENLALILTLSQAQLPNLLPLHEKIQTFVLTFTGLQTQPQPPQQLQRIQDEINLLRTEQYQELVIIQSQQHQLQGQLVTEITNLQTRQVSLEIEATKLGLKPATLPALTVLRAEVERLSTYLQTQQTPDVLIRIRGEVAHQLTQQQQALVIIQIYSFLFSEYTSCATHRRIASYGAFFAGKMMEYFFDEYIQLPSFFKYFESYLKHCFQYSTTTLIYDADVPPYNLIQIPDGSSFTLQFFLHFQKMGISFNAAATPDNPANAQHILATLQEKTSYIKAISHFLTKDFMKDTGALDDLSRVRSGESVSTASSASSARSDGSSLSLASESTTSSDESRSFCSFGEGTMGSIALNIFLSAASLDGSQASDTDYNPLLRRTRTQTDPYVLGYPDLPDGGNKPRLATVAITKRNRKYKTRSSPKRKSKSNNKSKSRHKRNSKITNKTFCRKRKSYLSRKPHKKQTLKKGVKR